MIEFLLIFGFFPVPVIYVDPDYRGLGKSAAYVSYVGPICYVTVSEDHRQDVGLMAHEIRHCEMIIRNFIGYYKKYSTEEGRLLIEAECYAVQIQAYGVISRERRNHLIRLFSGFMSTRYDLNFTLERCEMELQRQLDKLNELL